MILTVLLVVRRDAIKQIEKKEGRRLNVRLRKTNRAERDNKGSCAASPPISTFRQLHNAEENLGNLTNHSRADGPNQAKRLKQDELHSWAEFHQKRGGAKKIHHV